MKKGLKKLTLFATIVILGTSGFKIKKAKEESKIFEIKVEGYKDNFSKDNFDIIAHRGFSSLAVENSKKAITLAEEKKYIDGIEMDVRLTKDKKLVLSHADVVTTKNLEGIQVSDSTLKELVNTPLYHISNSPIFQIQNLFNDTDGKIIIDRQNKLENKKYHLISLENGLNLVKDKTILLDLKFKDNFKDFSNELESILNERNLENIIIQSNDLASLLKLKRENPDYECIAIIKDKENLQYMPYFDQVGIDKKLVSENEIKERIKNNKKTFVWTVNKTTDIDKIITELGEDAKNITYITDYPDTISMYLNDKFPSKEKTKKKK